MKIATTARKLKVTCVIDAAAFRATFPDPFPDWAPPRVEIQIAIDGRTYTADIASKSVRKAVKVLGEHGADNVALLVQGTLLGNRIEECGLVAQVKARPEAA